ncbi:unnamed protein product, partial [Prorocentrum cordatum]
DCGSPVGAAQVVGAAQARQRRASELSHSERLGALFGQASASSPSLAVSSRGLGGSSPLQRFGSEGALGAGSSAASPLRAGAGLSLGGLPFCPPSGGMGGLYLRVEAVKRNAERNKKELAANRAFMDEVHAMESSGAAALAEKRGAAGAPNEEEEEERGLDPRSEAALVHKRIDAMRENLQANRQEIEANRRKLDEMLVFGGKKAADVFDPVNFAKHSGLGKFALPAGGETSTARRLDSMTSNLKVNEARLREHRALLDGIREAKERGDSKQAPRGALPASEAATTEQWGGASASLVTSVRSLDVVRRPSGSLASRLEAVADAARGNALELRAFRGTIDEAQGALLREKTEDLAKTAPPVTRLFCSGQLRPARAAGPDRSKEIRNRFEVLSTNASRNFEQLSQQRHGLDQARRREEADAAERAAERRGSASPARCRAPGFGVAM